MCNSRHSHVTTCLFSIIYFVQSAAVATQHLFRLFSDCPYLDPASIENNAQKLLGINC